jgi:hypothetical protein
MLKLSKILQNLRSRVKAILPLCFVMFLTACNDSCETYQEFLNKGLSTIKDEDPIYGNCFFCPMFHALTESGAKAANKAWELLPDLLIPIVGLVMAIYVAISVLRNVGSFSKQDVANFLTDNKKGVLILGFKTAVIIALLSSDFLIRSIICPLIVASGEIGLKLASTETIGLKTTEFVGNIVASIKDILGMNQPWNTAFTLVYEVAKGFNDASYQLTALGNSLNCNATDSVIFTWEWLMLVYGNIYTIFGWIASVGVCFYLVNMILNFTIGAILLPLGIAFAVSDKTMQYTKNIWGIFLNTFCNFIMMGIVIGLSLQLINMSMGVAVEEDGSDATLTSMSMNIIQLLNGNQIDQLSDQLWENGSLILTIVMLSIVVKLVQQIDGLAKKLSETSGVTSAGAKAFAPVQKAAGKAAGKLLTGAGKTLKEGAKTTARHTPTVLNHWYTKSGAKKAVNSAYRRTGLQTAVNFIGNGYNSVKSFVSTGLQSARTSISNAVYNAEMSVNRAIRGDGGNSSTNNGGNDND